ncbi:MAG: 16S rRNA (cytidine(1402)-2'-O)-methyltransferase [Pseudomonadota bacterium]|nr:16S rRNA (cytidine(1402)-2'-O)-methyltransferase [Pseudomonadota bacterium]
MKSNDFEKRLYVVATPIGNLTDISQRAVDILKQVDVILCENTKHSLRLLNHYGICPKKIFKLTEYESQKDIQRYLSHCEKNGIALISDAGTPLISDPGKGIVEMAHGSGFGVLSVPGPCAVIAALSICPFQVMPFSFEGFLSRKKGERVEKLNKMKTQSGAMVFYESPNRVLAFCEDLMSVFGRDRQVFVVKELTKRFECYWKGSLQEVCTELVDANKQGEFVVIVAGDDASSDDGMEGEELISLQGCMQQMKESGVSLSSAKRILAPLVAIGKNKLYQRLLVIYGEEEK